jgi:hypothetical protein
MDLIHSFHGKKAWSLKSGRKIYFYGKCDLFYVNIISFAQIYGTAHSKQRNYVTWTQTEDFLNFKIN